MSSSSFYITHFQNLWNPGFVPKLSNYSGGGKPNYTYFRRMYKITSDLMKNGILVLGLVFSFGFGFAQSSFIPLNQNSEYFLDRIETKTGKMANDFHTSVKPYSRQAVSKYIQSLTLDELVNLNRVDRENLDFIKEDNWEYFKEDVDDSKPLWNTFFKRKSAFFSVDNPDFEISASPILGLNMGSNSAYGLMDSRQLSNNTRGVEVRARINDKLGIYTMFSDNITNPANYQVNYFNEYQGFPYESFIKIENDDMVKLRMNYFQALGYITFKPIKSLQMTFGHDKNFIGNGIRSLILSDFSAPYMQVRFDLKLGRLQYQNIFGQMTNRQIEIVPYSQVTNTPKYMAFHHLNFNVTKDLNFGLFENVMFGNRKIGFDLNYMNPLIFYRFIEGYLGSSDNAMVGADFKYNLLKTASFYGQFILDEFHKQEFKKDKWWGRKYGWQLGVKYYDVLGVENLDLQVEHNRVRPYTYSHFTTFTNYVNYNLPIAHPLGANFTENLVVLRYQPTQKLDLKVSATIAKKGMDKDSVNYGGNILSMNTVNRPGDYGNNQLQGEVNKIVFIDAKASYMLWHNIYADVNYRTRKDSYADGKETMFTVGLRWNFPYRNYTF